MRIKHDVDLRGIQPQAVIAAVVAEALYTKVGAAVVITSGVEGAHMEGSLHYKGLAIDIRLPFLGTGAKMRLDLMDALGPQYDVVLEKDHIHIEFQPHDKSGGI